MTVEVNPSLEAVVEVLGKSKFALNRVVNELMPVTQLMLYTDREAFELMSGGFVLWMLSQLQPEHADMVQETGLLEVLNVALLPLEATLGKEPELLLQLWQERSAHWFCDLFHLCRKMQGQLHQEHLRARAAGPEAGHGDGAAAVAEVPPNRMTTEEFFAELRSLLPAWRSNPHRCIEFFRFLACATYESQIGRSRRPVGLRADALETDPLGFSEAAAYAVMTDLSLQLLACTVQNWWSFKGGIRADTADDVLLKLKGKTMGVLRIVEGDKLHSAFKELVRGLPKALPIRKGLGKNPLKRK